jgi:hypothetical protein
MPNRPASIAAVSLAFVALGSAPARANPEAEAFFDEGVKLFNAGKIGEACDAFEASNTVEARAGTLIRLGECREKNHQLASAWSAYKDALVRVKDPSKKAFATKRVAELEPKLSYLTITVPPEARVDGLAITRNAKPVESVSWNRAVPVDGGAYAIVARAPGRIEWKTTADVPEQSGKITVDVKPLEAVKPITKPDDVPDAHASPHEKPVAVVQHDQPPPPRRSIGLPLAVGAGALALLGGAVGFDLWGDSTYNAAKAEMTDQSRRSSLYNSANAERYTAEAMLGAGVACAGVAVWLFLRHGNERAATTATRAIISPSGIALVGTF